MFSPTSPICPRHFFFPPPLDFIVNVRLRVSSISQVSSLKKINLSVTGPLPGAPRFLTHPSPAW